MTIHPMDTVLRLWHLATQSGVYVHRYANRAAPSFFFGYWNPWNWRNIRQNRNSPHYPKTTISCAENWFSVPSGKLQKTTL